MDVLCFGKKSCKVSWPLETKNASIFLHYAIYSVIFHLNHDFLLNFFPTFMGFTFTYTLLQYRNYCMAVLLTWSWASNKLCGYTNFSFASKSSFTLGSVSLTMNSYYKYLFIIQDPHFIIFMFCDADLLFCIKKILSFSVLVFATMLLNYVFWR